MYPLRILFSLAMMFLSASASLGATLNFKVVAQKTKVNEAPWDGMAGSGFGKGAIFFGVPTSGPPDLAICILVVGKKNDCKLHTEGKKFHSFCQNSFDCDFRDVDVTDNVFGVVIVDLDKVQQDLVDMVILINDANQDLGDIDALEKHVREVTEKLAPALTPGERQRRERPVQRFEVSHCSGDSECDLRQSTLRLTE